MTGGNNGILKGTGRGDPSHHDDMQRSQDVQAVSGSGAGWGGGRRQALEGRDEVRLWGP